MFSENQKISERQMARLLIFDMCGISTLLLPGLLGKMLGTDGVFAILLGAVPVYLFTFLPELLQEKRKNSNTRNGSNTSNISNIGKSYPEILKKQGNGFIRIFVLVVYTVEGILLAGYGLFLLSDLMVSELLKDSSFVLAAVLLMLLCGYGIWQGIEGRPITSTIRNYPYRVLCSVAGRDGEIATDQIRTVDKSRLKRKIGDLNFSEIKRLKEVFHQMFCE